MASPRCVVLCIALFLLTMPSATATTPPFYLPPGQEVTISVTTYTGSTTTQHVHPSILKFGTKINNYSYIIALTPYPGSDASYENPSIVFSNDLINYTEDGVSNPLALPPSGGHLADPDLAYDPVNDRLLLYYISRVYSTNDVWLHIQSSADGVNWQVVADIDVTTCGSPAVIYDRSDGKFKMWYVEYNFSTYEKTLYYLESPDGVNWNFSNKILVNYNKPYYNGAYYNVWHLSVQKVGNEYWMIAAANPVGTQSGAPPIHLFFGRSTDGINWTFYDTPILDTASSLATDRLYRADFLVENGTLIVLYSYLNADRTWHIALTSVDVSSLVDNISSENVWNVIVLDKFPNVSMFKVKVFSEVNFSVNLTSAFNYTWFVNNIPIKTGNSSNPTLNMTFNESGNYTIMLEVNGISEVWFVEVYKPVPMFQLAAPVSVEVGKPANIKIQLENLDELFDYEIEIDLDNDGVPEITTKDLNVTMSFSRPAKYRIVISVKDPITGAANMSDIYLQVYSFRLFKGYNVMNTTGAVILADSTEPVHVEIKPIKVTKEFTVVVSEENIYANSTSEVILNVTVLGLAGGDKIWLNETVAKARTVDLLHNGEPLIVAYPITNGSINVTLTMFSTYTLLVNNTVAPKTEERLQPSITEIVIVFVAIISIVLSLTYLLKKKKVIAIVKFENDFKFFRRI